MIYVKLSGRFSRVGVGLRLRQLLFRLGRGLMRLSGPGARPSGKEITVFNLDAESQATGFNAEMRGKLEKAAEDFEASMAGLYPVHAKKEGGYLDGGTTIWQGEGYSITVMKSMTTVGDIHGFMFGPVLNLDYPLAHGNTTQVSHVTFYAGAALESLLG